VHVSHAEIAVLHRTLSYRVLLQGAVVFGPGEPSGEKAGGEEGLAVPIGAIGLGEPSGAELLGDLMDQVCLERGQ
jgi:hypothetical protein